MNETGAPSMRMRLLGGLLVLAMLGPAWGYVATHDVAGGFRRFQAGKEFDRPQPQRRRAHHRRHGQRAPRHQRVHGAAPRLLPSPGALAQEAWAAVALPLELGALALLLAGSGIVLLRVRARWQRAETTETWQLMLGREDLAEPYEVETVIAGAAGALRARWYERVLFGQDHFAFEIHHTLAPETAFCIAAPARAVPALRAALASLYPDVQLERLDGWPERPDWFREVVRLKKRRSFVFSLQTTRDYTHSPVEDLATMLGQAPRGTSIQFVLVPAPRWLQRRARKLLERHERGGKRRERDDPLDPGPGSVIAAKEAKGALETQHRTLLSFELRVAGTDKAAVRRLAGLYAGTVESENSLAPRYMRLRRRLYVERMRRALPNPLPSYSRGVVSTSEFATLWQLPRPRAKHAAIARTTLRRAVAAPQCCDDPRLQLVRDERGPVGLWPADRIYGAALIGGQGMGKSATMLRAALADARQTDRAIILIDPKEDLARDLLAALPPGRVVHYLDLGAPECGLNPLIVPGTPESVASLFVQSLIEANPPGAIGASSDRLLRNAAAAVVAAEGKAATLHHVYQMLSAQPAYRDTVIAKLEERPELHFLHRFWSEGFAELAGARGIAVERLDPPRNKLSRLIMGIDVALHHPHQLDIDGIIERGEILIVNGAKGQVGEDNTRLVGQLVLQLVHRALQRQQAKPPPQRRGVSLFVDEAHNFLTTTVATLLAEGRSAGLWAMFAWQYMGQIVDELVRSGVKSLLQSLFVFRMRELEDARLIAALAMEIFEDRIGADVDSQGRRLISVDDGLRLPAFRAICILIAKGSPRPAFIGETLPVEGLDGPEADAQRADRIAEQHARGGGPLAYVPNPLAAPNAPEQRSIDNDEHYKLEPGPDAASEPDDDGDEPERPA